MCSTFRLAFVVLMVAHAFVGNGARAQCWTSLLPLSSSNGLQAGVFGQSVAVQGDVLIVGAPAEDTQSSLRSGAAYVFRHSGTTWVEEARLVASDAGTNHNFGISVSISGDRVVVGADRAPSAFGPQCGAAYVFERVNGAWTEQAKLTASDGATFDAFGTSVAVDSAVIVVGAPADATSAGSLAGSAYVYSLNGTVWAEAEHLVAPDATPFASFGVSVDVSGDAIVIGAPFQNVGGSLDAGSAYVFRRSGATWGFESTLATPGASGNDSFGGAVSISGGVVIVGAFTDTPGALAFAGSASIFRFAAGTWNFEQRLTPPNGVMFDNFGSAVTLESDVVVVGARADVGSVDQAGTAHVFRRRLGAWQHNSTLLPPQPEVSGYFGSAVALSEGRVVVGEFQDDNAAGQDAGIVFVSDVNAPTFVWQPMPSTENQGTQEAAFAVVAQGSAPIAYQWNRDGVPLEDGASAGGGQVIGATMPTLFIAQPGAADAGQYRCVVTDDCSTAVSGSAALSVIPPVAFCAGDADGSGVVNFADITATLTSFNNICP